ncbi:ComEC/Rec2 family competence protein [bacterium]|nr:ComEC/Rec2 family competence protein [bacterium]
MKKYPALFTAITFIIGITLSRYIDLPIQPLLIFFFAIVVLGIYLHIKSSSKVSTLFLLFAVIVAGFIRFEISEQCVPANDISFFLNADETQTVRGFIASDPEIKGERTKFEFRTKSIKQRDKWIPSSGKILVTVLGERDWLEYGDYIEFESKIKAPYESSNYNTFDYKEYLERHHIYAQTFLYDLSKLVVLEKGKGNPFLKYVIQPIRHRIKYTIWNTLKGNHAALLEGMMLGRGRKLPVRVKEYFSNTGVIHILAVSGLHIGIWALIFFQIFKNILRLKYKWATFLTIGVLAIYMFVCNLRPSITRAWIMSAVIMIGFLVERRINLLNNLGFAALIILVLSPIRLFHMGFQLSFLAVSGIAILYPRLEELIPREIMEAEGVPLKLVNWVSYLGVRGKAILYSRIKKIIPKKIIEAEKSLTKVVNWVSLLGVRGKAILYSRLKEKITQKVMEAEKSPIKLVKWVSFLALRGKAILYSRLKEKITQKIMEAEKFKLKLVKWILQAFLVSFSVTMFAAPVTMYYFHKFQLIAPLANLFVIPVMFIVIALGITMVFTGLIPLGIAKIFAAANWLVLSCLLWVVGFFAKQPWAFIPVQAPSVWFFIGWFGVVLLFSYHGFKWIWIQLKIRPKIAIPALSAVVVAIALLIVLSATGPKANNLTILFFDVGQGDSALLHFPNGKNMIIDGGDETNYFFTHQPYLWSQGSLAKGFWNGITKGEWTTTIHAMVGTHPQSDHIGGFPPIIDDFIVKKVYDIGAGYPSQLYKDYLAKIKENDIEFKVVTAGDTIKGFGEVEVLVLHPDSMFVNKNGDYYYDINEGSIVLKVTYKDASFLFTGDIGTFSEFYLTKKYEKELEVDVLKVGHHGSKTSSSELFLETVNPKVGVISVGRKNRFRHPSPEVVARMDSLDIVILKTSEDGAILMETDGKEIWVESKLKGDLFTIDAVDPSKIERITE